MEDRNIAYSLRNKLQGDDFYSYSYRAMKCPEAEDRLYQIEVLRDVW